MALSINNLPGVETVEYLSMVQSHHQKMLDENPYSCLYPFQVEVER